MELLIGAVAALAAVVLAGYGALQYHQERREKKKHDLENRNETIPQQSITYTGRITEKNEIIDLLNSRTFLIEIVGLGGIGKTALTIEIARFSLCEKIFDRVIWISAKHQLINLESFLRELFSMFIHPVNLDISITQSQEFIKRKLSSLKILIIIDNYEEIDDFRINAFLQNLPAPSKAIVTTRHASLDNASHYRLGGLTQEDAKNLIKAEIELLNIELSSDIASEEILRLYSVSNGVPFVIKWFLGQVNTGQSWEILLQGLEKADLSAEELYDYIFNRTFNTMEKGILDILIACSLFRNPFSFEDLMNAMGENSPDYISRCLARLVDQSLLSTELDNKLKRKVYIIHPLTRRYVLHLINTGRYVQEKVENFYLNILIRAKEDTEIIEPSYPFLNINYATALSAINWFEINLKWEELLDTQQSLSRFLWVKGHWLNRIEYGEKGLKAARFCRNSTAEAAILMDDLGWTTYALKGDIRSSKQYLEKSKDIYDRIIEPFGQVKVRRHLAAIERNEGNLEKAKEFYNEASSIINKISDEYKRFEMEAGLQLSLGKLSLEENNLELALNYFEKAIKLYEKNKDPLRVIKVLNFKAKGLVRINKYLDAKEILNLVLEQSMTLGRLDQIALAYELLAKIYYKKGNRFLSKQKAREAANLYTTLGDHKSLFRLKKQWPSVIKDK